MLNNKTEYVLAANGWTVYEDDGFVDLMKKSTAGEDFGFTVSAEHFVEEIEEYAESFDAEEHAAMWYEAKLRGSRDVPSLRVLLDDADAIQEMLDDLVVALREL